MSRKLFGTTLILILLTAAAVAASSDVVLMLQRGLEGIGGVSGLLKLPSRC